MLSAEELSESLQIPVIESENLRLDDCRRLMGPGLFWDKTGAVADIYFSGFDPEKIGALWHEHGRVVLDGLGWHGEELTIRFFDGGANLAMSAPLDQLFTCAFAAETAWHFCAAALLGTPSGNVQSMIADLRGLSESERNIPLIRIAAKASRFGLDVLIDDDAVSVGHGSGSMTWPLAKIPGEDSVEWALVHNIPVALITGTNGKTTTTRLCAAMARKSGLRSGLSSTDGVWIGNAALGTGDYSGPAGARLLLRDRTVQTAVLEIARGGILRRGLPVRFAKVAVVTNVAADHLGHYGINTLADLAKVKMSVHQGLMPGGVLVLNADDPLVVAEASRLGERKWWFSLDAQSALIMASLAMGVPCAWYDRSAIFLFDGTSVRELIKAVDVPISLHGSARYNLQNALAALLASRALGVEEAAIVDVLATFRNDPADNPGRCNEFAWNGARVFVDFAHNPHSIAAVTSALKGLPAQRRLLLISHAGDRSDQDIRDLAHGAHELGPDVVVTAENPGYLRGRNPGEVPNIIRDQFVRLGLRPDAIHAAPRPFEGAEMILRMLRPGDIALLLVHADREQIFAMLKGHETT